MNDSIDTKSTFPHIVVPAAWYSDEYIAPSTTKITEQDYLNLNPQEICRMLTKHVIEQDEACKAVAIMMYQHLHGHRSVNMLAGPTGSGKSFLTETLKDIFPDIVMLRNIADLTCDGWSGSKKVRSLFQALSSGPSHTRFEKFMVLDEADKCFLPKSSSGGGMPSEDVQAELLAVVHGSYLSVPSGKESSITINTRKMSFLFAGAFERQAKKIASEKSSGIGFGASLDKTESYDDVITMEDVHNAGCINELCGRIGKIIPLNKISADSYRKMLNNSNAGPLFELESEFNIKFQISESAKDDICHNAYSSELGIRSIKNQLRNYIDSAIWEDTNIQCIEIS